MENTTEVPGNRITVTLDLEDYMDEESMMERLESRIIQRVSDKYEKTVKHVIDQKVQNIIEEQFAEGIGVLLEPVAKEAKYAAETAGTLANGGRF